MARCVILVVSVMTALSATAHADPVLSDEHDHQGVVQHNVVTAKFVGGAAVSGEHNVGLAGAALTYERELIRGWLLAEASVGLLLSSEDKFVPIELVFKKPFQLSDMFELYVGLGPALTLQPQAGMHLIWGGVATLGTYVWLSRHVGVLIEFDYNLVSEDHHAVSEFEGAVGVAFRF